jgi:hypothetical protein
MHPGYDITPNTAVCALKITAACTLDHEPISGLWSFSRYHIIHVVGNPVLLLHSDESHLKSKEKSHILP